MAPGITIDTAPDFGASVTEKDLKLKRTLILAPPSVAAHPETLGKVAEAYDRSATDIQMLDRLAMGLVALPAATYDLVLLLTGVGDVLDRRVMEMVVKSMRPLGKLRCNEREMQSQERTEAILAGLESDPEEGMVKPNAVEAQTVKLNFRRKANASAVPANAVEEVNGARTNRGMPLAQAGVPNGVGFDDGEDELEIPDEEELLKAEAIDPNTLLTEEDRKRPIIVPEACKPNSKRRRACKDCTCGLAERLAEEDKVKRADADSNLAKLSANDLNEVDFTVKGKVGSCGNCALGDAFRCDGCPYIGLPAFKPGEEVRLLNNEVQL
ncbi:DUF689-domain-containing protein [Piedraia hortae CBS 480.64]|uniref:DUF689-domain-containing protein n=1 Tax=Piedraia hortae CBS 480.64 TaxID=1314780 RepID=A0A6A7C8Y7_9PEZI|nr:DUF689-domain-containing protein [Piedraia hortae CBS 480.64]